MQATVAAVAGRGGIAVAGTHAAVDAGMESLTDVAKSVQLSRFCKLTGVSGVGVAGREGAGVAVAGVVQLFFFHERLPSVAVSFFKVSTHPTSNSNHFNACTSPTLTNQMYSYKTNISHPIYALMYQTFLFWPYCDARNPLTSECSI